MRNVLEQFWSMRAALRLAPRSPTRSLRVHRVAFWDPDACLAAARKFREEGFHVEDIYAPFPVHGMDEALGLAPTRLGWATFGGGLFGLVAAVVLQSWIHGVDWPLNIGGKSYFAWPSQIPVAFELTVLCAAIATTAALLWLGRLIPRLARGLRGGQPSSRVTDDLFLIVVMEKDASFDPEVFQRICRRHDGEEQPVGKEAS